MYEDLRYPSYSMALLIDELIQRRPAEGATVSRLREELLSLAGRALQAERDHMLNSFHELLNRTEETLENQSQDRFDALDIFIDSLADRQEEGASMRIQDLSEELGAIIHLPQFRLTSEQMRWITEDPEQLREQLRAQIDSYTMSLAINRAIGAMERRLGESMNLRSNSFEEMTWPEISDQLMQTAENVLDRQYERLLGDGKGISRDIDPYLDRLTDYTTDEGQLLELFGIMTEGQRLVFDRRTHRQGYQITHRLNYAFLAGQMLQDRPIPEVSDQVLEQLEGAQQVLQETWGRFEWDRLSQNHVVLEQLENRLKARLAELIGTERFAEVCNQPLESLRSRRA